MSRTLRDVITCSKGHKLGEVLQVQGTVVYQTKCHNCNNLYHITLSPTGPSVVKVDVSAPRIIQPTHPLAKH